MKNGMKLFIGLMAAHWLEHLFQAYQVYVMHLPRACALGMLGMKFPWLVRTESLHFLFAVLTTVMLVKLKEGFEGLAYFLWDLALSISLWHLLEHSLLFYQAVTGHFLFGQSQPTSILQLGFPRIELHLFYNSIVTIPAMLAILVNDTHPDVGIGDYECPTSDFIGDNHVS